MAGKGKTMVNLKAVRAVDFVAGRGVKIQHARNLSLILFFEWNIGSMEELGNRNGTSAASSHILQSQMTSTHLGHLPARKE